MSMMASQITSLTIVYSTFYSGADQRKLHITGLCEGNSPVTVEFPAQRASNAENLSIWWRHPSDSSLKSSSFRFGGLSSHWCLKALNVHYRFLTISTPYWTCWAGKKLFTLRKTFSRVFFMKENWALSWFRVVIQYIILQILVAVILIMM